jgi:glycosyltransferase A (GT-A) superfamily protein (DUF2064 family)
VRPTLAVLADAPESGVVLPRVAAEIGTAHATRLYRVLLARAIAAARGAGFHWTVWFRPADAAPMLRRWLGDDTDLRPQASGTLGARAAAAVAGSNLPAGWMVLLRPVSGIDAALLRHAALLLVDMPIVLGAAADGGVYLVGARTAPPPVLRQLDDAGPGALAWLRTALDDAGIPVAELPVRRTITSAADARAARLLA